jgi:hypothetical protein
MSEELDLLDAGLFQLKSAAASIDPMFGTQMQFTIGVLSNAIEAARPSVSPAAVTEIEFALNDVTEVIDQLSASDADRMAPIIAMLQEDLAKLKESTSLAVPIVEGLRALQEKLRVRRRAIQQHTFREAGAEEALPHPPEELHADAATIRPLLTRAGFATPALDELIADPTSLRLHSIDEILNELDVIVGD